MADVHPLIAVLVTGTRELKNWVVVRRALAAYPPGSVLIHGDCRGADRMAGEVGKDLFGFSVIPMPAQWEKDGVTDKNAGNVRNQHMLDVLLHLRSCGYSIYAEAFPSASSVGTRNMIRLLGLARVQTNVHEV